MDRWLRRAGASALVGLVVGCGRVGFDVASSDGGDSRADAGVDGRDAGRDAGCTLGPWSVRELGELNSNATDWGGQISLDGLTYFFASNRPDGASPDFNVYVARRPTRASIFGEPSLVGGVNTATGEGDVTISDDLGELCFMRSGEIMHATLAPGGDYVVGGSYGRLVTPAEYLAGPFLAMGGLALFYSRHTCESPCSQDRAARIEVAMRAGPNDDFETYLPVPLDGPPILGYPALSADGLTLFVEGRTVPGEPTDTYETTRTSTSAPWGPLRPMPGINTPGEESDPSITADGRELFFASETPTSHDLFVATRDCL